MQREIGRVKYWDENRGYGFIRADNGRDVFVHVSATGFLSPRVGDRVSFEVGTNPRSGKPEAKAVAITDGD